MTDSKSKLHVLTPQEINPLGVIALLEETLEEARNGGLVEVQIFGRRPNGVTYFCASACKSSQETAGAFLDAAILRLGYAVR